MAAEIIFGTHLADEILLNLKEKVKHFSSLAGRAPNLTTIQVGDDLTSTKYIKMKQNKAIELGFDSRHYDLKSGSSTRDLENLLKELSNDEFVDSILVQYPTPSGVDYESALLAMDPDKDVDGLHPVNLGKLAQFKPGPIPCTPNGIVYMLQKHGIGIAGKHVFVLGRGLTLGRPLSLLLSSKDPSLNAMVTVAHSGVNDWQFISKVADIVISATGSPGILKKEHVKQGAVVVGAGVRYSGNKLLPDVDEDVSEVASHVTARVGGVGPMTIAMLFKNAYELAEKRLLK